MRLWSGGGDSVVDLLDAALTMYDDKTTAGI